MAEINGLKVLAAYAALLGVLFFVLSVLTIRQRGAAGVSLGDGGDDILLRRMRAHANFAEYVPIALLLIAGAIVAGADILYVHVCGIALLAGRVLHPIALYTRSVKLRVAGMLLTFLVILGASLLILRGVAGQL